MGVGKKKQFNLLQVNKIIDSYNSGEHPRKIGATFKCDESVIKRILKENHIHIRNKSEAKIGTTLSDETKYKIGLSGIGRTPSEETKIKLKISNLKTYNDADKKRVIMVKKHKTKINNLKLSINNSNRHLNDNVCDIPEIYNEKIVKIEETEIFNSLNEEITFLYSKKMMSTYKISDKFNIPRRNIGNILKSENIALRTSSEQSRKYDLDEHAFSGELNEEKAYWIGFIMADGCICKSYKKYNILEIGLQARDVGHVIKLQKFLKTDKPIVYNKRPNSYTLSVNSDQIAKDLNYYGITPRKSLTAQAKNIDGEYERDFWRGIIDGDGSLHISQQKPNFNLVGSNDICNSFKNFLLKNEVNTSAKISEKANVYYFSTGGTYLVMDICDLLYKSANIYLDRKYNFATNLINELYKDDELCQLYQLG